MLKRGFTRLYWRIGDVSTLTGIPQPMLRSWEQEFGQLRPRRDASGVRVYRERDFRLVLLLRRLLEDEGCTYEKVHEHIGDDPDNLSRLLEAVDFASAIGLADGEPPVPERGRNTTVGEKERDKGPETPDEEQDIPTPWDDAALAEWEESDGLPAGSQDGTIPHEMAVLTDEPGDEPENGDTFPAADASAEEMSSDAVPPSYPNRSEHLPPWAVAELAALRKELAALMHMLDELVLAQTTDRADRREDG